MLESKTSSKITSLTTDVTSVTTSTGKMCPLISHSSQRKQKELYFDVQKSNVLSPKLGTPAFKRKLTKTLAFTDII